MHTKVRINYTAIFKNNFILKQNLHYITEFDILIFTHNKFNFPVKTAIFFCYITFLHFGSKNEDKKLLPMQTRFLFCTLQKKHPFLFLKKHIIYVSGCNHVFYDQSERKILKARKKRLKKI
jgi:hypothetical protein